jgi:replicative DNA helicase
VLLAQLNRSDGKQETDPRVDSLKESGSLEQDADTIILLGNVESQDESTVTEKLVRIAKNRHGPLADLTLNFNNPTTRFY